MSCILPLPASPLRNKQFYRRLQQPSPSFLRKQPPPPHRLQLACVMDVCFPVQGPIAPFPVLAPAWVGRGAETLGPDPTFHPPPLGSGFLPLEQLLL